MTTVMASRAVGGPAMVADPRFDGEIALRSEIEALRTKARDQAQLIARLESGGAAPAPAAGGADAEVDRLRRSLADAEEALSSVRRVANNDSSIRAAVEGQVSALRTRAEDQEAELARLKAALAAYESDGSGDRPSLVRDSRLASKARLSALQAQVNSQNDIIQRLRSELASNNERLARQAQLHAEEMRRLGGGTVQTGVENRTQRDATAAQPVRSHRQHQAGGHRREDRQRRSRGCWRSRQRACASDRQGRRLSACAGARAGHTGSSGRARAGGRRGVARHR